MMTSARGEDDDCTRRGSGWTRRGSGTGTRLALFLATLTLGCAPAAPTPEAEETALAARPNYSVRLDSESSAIADFLVVEDDDGVRVQTGPAGIAYREDDVILTGDMNVQATFRQYDAPIGYREAYGLFLGGIDLAGEDPEYTYLLIRPTGDFLVKRRIGAITETLVDWTNHPAVRTVEVEGDEPVNVLSIDIFNGETHFVVNGDIVHSAPASRVRPYGVAGIRVNHRLDIRVDRWILRATSVGS